MLLDRRNSCAACNQASFRELQAGAMTIRSERKVVRPFLKPGLVAEMMAAAL